MASTTRPAGPATCLLDVHVLADGTVVPTDAAALIAADPCTDVPEALCDLAAGLLASGTESVAFVWTGHAAGAPHAVRLDRTRLGTREAAHLRVEPLDPVPFDLSPRELDVVWLLIAGLTSAAIAEALVVSPRTVTTHLEHIMAKLGAPSRAAVATAALAAGLVSVPLAAPVEAFVHLRVGRVLRAAATLAATSARPGPPTSTASAAGAAATGPIVIGALIPFEGRARDDGVEMLRGATLAVDELNARGGVRGRPVRLVARGIDVDHGGLASVRAAMHALLRGGAHAVTSGYLVHQAEAIELAADAGTPLLHAAASSVLDDLVSGDESRYRPVFQVCPCDRDYAPSFVRDLTQLRDAGGWEPSSRELVVAHQEAWDIIDFGIDRAAELASADGWELAPVRVADRTMHADAWSALPGRLGEPAAVMLGSFLPEDHLRFMTAFREAPRRTLVYSIYAPSIPAFKARLGADADGLLWSSTTGTYGDDLARDFATRYRARFGVAPGRSMAGVAYDRVQLLEQAWRQVADAADGDAVADALRSTRFRGVNGSYRFPSRGHATLSLGTASADPSLAQAHTIFQIRGGDDVLLDPSPYATGRFEPPSWFAA